MAAQPCSSATTKWLAAGASVVPVTMASNPPGASTAGATGGRCLGCPLGVGLGTRPAAHGRSWNSARLRWVVRPGRCQRTWPKARAAPFRCPPPRPPPSRSASRMCPISVPFKVASARQEAPRFRTSEQVNRTPVWQGKAEREPADHRGSREPCQGSVEDREGRVAAPCLGGRLDGIL